MSWFGKRKDRDETPCPEQKIETPCSVTDEEKRENKVKDLKGSIQKLNVDEELNDDEIARVSQMSHSSRRLLDENPKLESPTSGEKKGRNMVQEVSKTVPHKNTTDDEPETTAEDVPVSPVVRIIEEHYEAQFWD